MGTLYVIGTPASNPDDLTLRAKRILGEIALVVSDGPDALGLLASHAITVPHVILSDPAQPSAIDRILDSLEHFDAAILCPGTAPGPTGPSQAVIRAAIERDFPVVPVPGPTLPLTALVISGLPADSFVYLGELPRQSAARKNLLASIAAQPRTLVILESPEHFLGLLSDLHETLGDRLLAVTSSSKHSAGTWHGTIASALGHQSVTSVADLCVLVVGGFRENAAPWDEDYLRAEIKSRLEQGPGIKEISRELAAESGWPRREIYRLAVESDRFHEDRELW